MFYKGFICGGIGLAAVVMLLAWGLTPRGYGNTDIVPDKPGFDMGYDYRAC